MHLTSIQKFHLQFNMYTAVQYYKQIKQIFQKNFCGISLIKHNIVFVQQLTKNKQTINTFCDIISLKKCILPRGNLKLFLRFGNSLNGSITLKKKSLIQFLSNLTSTFYSVAIVLDKSGANSNY